MSREFYNLRDSYTYYKERSKKPIPISLYLKINQEFMRFLSEKLLESGEIKLPERLGSIQVIGIKTKVQVENNKIKGLAPNWKETKNLWEKDAQAKQDKKLIFHFNENTGGIRYRFFWSRNRVLVNNKMLYNLRMTRANKRQLAKSIQDGKEYLIKS